MISVSMIGTSEIDLGVSINSQKTIILTRRPAIIQLDPVEVNRFKISLKSDDRIYYFSISDNKLHVSEQPELAAVFKAVPVSGTDAFRFEVSGKPGFFLRADQKRLVISGTEDLNAEFQTAFILKKKRRILKHAKLKKMSSSIVKKNTELLRLKAHAEEQMQRLKESEKQANEYKMLFDQARLECIQRAPEWMALKRQVFELKRLVERAHQS
jgi:hypothetical protein